MTIHAVQAPGLSLATDLPAAPPDSDVPSVSVSLERVGRWRIVKVAGEMDIQVPPLVADVLDRDADRVVFELREVTFLDASGLGMMVSIRRRIVESSGCLRLVAPSRQVRRLLVLTGIDRDFFVCGSVDEAMSAPIGTGS